MVMTHSQHTQQAADDCFHIKVAELRERYFHRLPYDAVLLKWPLNMVGLNDEGKRIEYDLFFLCDAFWRPLLSATVWELTVRQLVHDKIVEEDTREANREIILCGEVYHQGFFRCNWSSMHSKPSISTSKFVVSLSSGETSSSGRDDDCSVMEETINSVETILEKYEGRSSGYLYSDSVRPKFFDFESAGIAQNDHLLSVEGNCMHVPDEPAFELNHIYYNLKPKPSSMPDKTSLFDCIAQDQDELKKLGMRRDKRVDSVVHKLSMLLKGAKMYLEKRSQEFGVKFEAQSARIKKLDAKLKLEKEKKAEDATAAAEVAKKYTDIKLGRTVRYSKIDFPLEVADEGMADAATTPEKMSDHLPGSVEPVPSVEKVLSPLSERNEIVSLPGKILGPSSEPANLVHLVGSSLEASSENAKAENMWFTKGDGKIIGENPILRPRELSSKEDEEEVKSLIHRSRHKQRQQKVVAFTTLVELIAIQSQCDVLRIQNGQLNVELSSCKGALKSIIGLEESMKAEIARERNIVARLSKDLHKKKAAQASELRKIELKEIISKKEVKTVADDVYERDMRAVILFFASEFKRLEVESKLVYDGLVGEGLPYDMEVIRSKLWIGTWWGDVIREWIGFDNSILVLVLPSGTTRVWSYDELEIVKVVADQVTVVVSHAAILEEADERETSGEK
ncbi:hypothetical protein GIB67_023784 [Kingdonia uniflora]|uniref:Uncharacterized protein n=1 Tax=Kingdonia uniflora TaxID=39325 RepID=A0A7J7NGC2_9MAGN|nr:hypothetical protein GIB67_023784 [Kingdonia uniflora]